MEALKRIISQEIASPEFISTQVKRFLDLVLTEVVSKNDRNLARGIISKWTLETRMEMSRTVQDWSKNLYVLENRLKEAVNGADKAAEHAEKALDAIERAAAAPDAIEAERIMLDFEREHTETSAEDFFLKSDVFAPQQDNDRLKELLSEAPIIEGLGDFARKSGNALRKVKRKYRIYLFSLRAFYVVMVAVSISAGFLVSAVVERTSELKIVKDLIIPSYVTGVLTSLICILFTDKSVETIKSKTFHAKSLKVVEEIDVIHKQLIVYKNKYEELLQQKLALIIFRLIKVNNPRVGDIRDVSLVHVTQVMTMKIRTSNNYTIAIDLVSLYKYFAGQFSDSDALQVVSIKEGKE